MSLKHASSEKFFCNIFINRNKLPFIEGTRKKSALDPQKTLVLDKIHKFSSHLCFHAISILLYFNHRNGIHLQFSNSFIQNIVYDMVIIVIIHDIRSDVSPKVSPYD